MISWAILFLGTCGFMYTESWGPWQAFYLTLVTLTTVGYGDFGVSPAGQRVSVMLMIGGIATMSYLLSQIIQYATSRTINPEVRMIRAASQMNDHFIVCGLGQTGLRIARKLVGEGHDVVVIDSCEENISTLRADGFVAIQGDAANDDTLLVAGAQRARGLSAVTSCDASNAMICLSASAVNPKLPIVARAESDSSVGKLRRAGASTVINPSRYSGDGIVDCLVRPEVSNLLYGNDSGSLRFAEYKADRFGSVNVSTFRELLESNPKLVLIASKSQDGELRLRPDLDETMDPNSTLIFAGTPDQIARLGRGLPVAA